MPDNDVYIGDKVRLDMIKSQLQETIDDLRKRNGELQKENDDLRVENYKLRDVIKKIREGKDE